jgi:hypothetical protein
LSFTAGNAPKIVPTILWYAIPTLNPISGRHLRCRNCTWGVWLVGVGGGWLDGGDSNILVVAWQLVGSAAVQRKQWH